MSVVPDAPASGRSLHEDPGLMTKVVKRIMREMRSLSFPGDVASAWCNGDEDDDDEVAHFVSDIQGST